MPGLISRRGFNRGIVATGFSGLALAACGQAADGGLPGYGDMVEDPGGLLDLPARFSYKVLIRAGDMMSDGHASPTNADGTGCFDLGGDKVALVRNHELSLGDIARAPWAKAIADEAMVFDRMPGGVPAPGGTTTLIYDSRSGRIEKSFRSLAGTARNCAGGVTPWGSWLSCEEDVTLAGAHAGRDHGWVFEVPARHHGLTSPVPLRALGRFHHEAVAVDAKTGIAYLTEDRDDGLFYRFLPDVRGDFRKGGRLQALRMRGSGIESDARNWETGGIESDDARAVEWIDLAGVESAADDLRKRGHQAGATLFARGEGITMGGGELYFACTSGGRKRAGQIMRYRSSRFEGQSAERQEPATLEVFIESVDQSELNFADNLTMAPNGHVFLCEDGTGSGGTKDNHVRAISPEGVIYPIARLRLRTELTGINFSPDGTTMFLNIYHPGQTLAITGPWAHLA